MMKGLCDQLGSMINLLTTVLAKHIMAKFLKLAVWNANGLMNSKCSSTPTT
jgi:hypothetical protein